MEKWNIDKAIVEFNEELLTLSVGVEFDMVGIPTGFYGGRYTQAKRTVEILNRMKEQNNPIVALLEENNKTTLEKKDPIEHSEGCCRHWCWR